MIFKHFSSMSGKSILFVCTGNICRSPVAAALCSKMAKENLKVSSAAISSHHVNERADDRTLEVVQKHGLDISHHRARQIRADDWMLFDFIVALDKKVYKSLLEMKPNNSKSKVILYADIRDPFFSGRSGFTKMFEDIQSCMPQFLLNNNICHSS